eukprot:g16030.t3
MSLGDEPKGFSPLHQADEPGESDPGGETADPIEKLFRYQPPSRANSSVSGRMSSAVTVAGVSPSGDSLCSTSRGSRVGAGAFMRSESCERLEDSGGIYDGYDPEQQQQQPPPPPPPLPQQQQQQQRGPILGVGSRPQQEVDPAPDQHPVGPVDRILLLVDDGQSLSRRVLGNERQSARLGERLSALKTPLWQLQARVRTQAERPPEFLRTLTEQVSHCLDVLLELTHPDWWNQIRRKHDAAVFRDLNDRLVNAVRGDRQFEAALRFPRAADEDRADRIVDFEHLQGVLEVHAERLDDRAEDREELWKAIESLRLAEPSDITGFTEIDRDHVTFDSGMPLNVSGNCVEASWHGSRVAVKQLLAPSRTHFEADSGGGGGGGGGRLGWARAAGAAPRVVSAAAASAIRREVRLLQALRSEFLVPIYGACTAPPNGVMLVMPLAPFGSLHAFLHEGVASPAAAGTMGMTDRAAGGVLRRGLSRSSSIGNGMSGGGGGGGGGWGGGQGGGAGATGGAAGRHGEKGTGGVGGGRPHLSAALKAAMAFDVARGMLHLHEKGFLHGALKPKNVLVFDNLRLMVSDFGLGPVKEANARLEKEMPRRKDGSVESPAVSVERSGPGDDAAAEEEAGGDDCWVAPEVALDGEEHTHQSDLFSYGGVLYELLTESLPRPSLADGTAAAKGRSSFTSDGRPPSATGDAAAPTAAAAAAAGWVPRVPAGVEAHPGQVQLMQRCLRHERQLRPGGFYVIVSFLHDLVKSLGGDERRKNALGLGPPSTTAETEPVVAAAPNSIGVDGGSGRSQRGKDWSAEERQAAFDAQARLERQLAESQARCAELEEAERKASAAAKAAATARLEAAENVAAAAAAAFAGGHAGPLRPGSRRPGSRRPGSMERAAITAAVAAAAEEKAMAADGSGGGDGGGGGGGGGSVIETDPEKDAGAWEEEGNAVSVANGGIQRLPDNVVRAFVGDGGGRDADSDEGLSRRRKSRERAREMGMLVRGKNNNSSQSQSQSGDSLYDDGGGGGLSKDAADSGTRALSTRLREAQEREKAMQKEIEDMRARERTMRGELVNGLAGAVRIKAQLKEGKQREQELRATNAILQAKVLIHEATNPAPATPTPHGPPSSSSSPSATARAAATVVAATAPSAAATVVAATAPSAAAPVAAERRPGRQATAREIAAAHSVTTSGIAFGKKKPTTASAAAAISQRASTSSPPPKPKVTPAAAAGGFSSSSAVASASSGAAFPGSAETGAITAAVVGDAAQRAATSDGGDGAGSCVDNAKAASTLRGEPSSESAPSSSKAVKAVVDGESPGPPVDKEARREIRAWERRVSHVLSANDQPVVGWDSAADSSTSPPGQVEEGRAPSRARDLPAEAAAAALANKGRRQKDKGRAAAKEKEKGVESSGGGSGGSGEDSRSRRDGDDNGVVTGRVGKGRIGGRRRRTSAERGSRDRDRDKDKDKDAVHQELKKERHLSKQYLEEKSAAEAEIARLKEELEAARNAGPALATTTTTTATTGAVAAATAGGSSEAPTRRRSSPPPYEENSGVKSLGVGGGSVVTGTPSLVAVEAQESPALLAAFGGGGSGPGPGPGAGGAGGGKRAAGAPQEFPPATAISNISAGSTASASTIGSQAALPAASGGAGGAGLSRGNSNRDIRSGGVEAGNGGVEGGMNKMYAGGYSKTGGNGSLPAPVASVGGGGRRQRQRQRQRQLEEWEGEEEEEEEEGRQKQQALPMSSSRMLDAYPLPMGLTAQQQKQQKQQQRQHQSRRHLQQKYNPAAAAAAASMAAAFASEPDGGDRAALSILFHDCHGLRWLRRAGWDGDLDRRHGVAWTDSERPRVLKLELGTNRIEGYIPKEIGVMSRLLCLRLDHNQLMGLIPPELGLLSALQQLELQGNALTGVIPRELGGLVNLQYLGLHDNQLLGEIPSELGQLTKLQHLALCNNRLLGHIPPELGELRHLEQMYLNHNQLSGPIPPALGRLTSLNKLRLENNRLEGSIPMELGMLTRLQYVNLGYNGVGNQLTGEIPVKAFAKMPHLAWLSMTDNPGLTVKRGRFVTTTQSMLKKVLPPKCDIFL